MHDGRGKICIVFVDCFMTNAAFDLVSHPYNAWSVVCLS